MKYIYGSEGRGGRGFARMLLVAMLGGVLGALLVLYSLPVIYPDLGLQAAPDPPPAQDQGQDRTPDSGGIVGIPFAGDSVVDIVEAVGPAVVGVVSLQIYRDYWTGREFERAPGGSGVIIDPRGYIVTNYHVIQDAQEVLVSLQDGRQVEAEITGIDPPTDLAVLKIGDGTEEFPSASFADSDKIRVGELAVAIGNPISLRFQRSVTVGVVSGIRDMLYGQQDGLERVFQLIQTDASINPGNSGGPLLDGRAAIIGINTLKIADATTEGMGFAIPSNTVKRITDDLIKEGHVRRAWLGISVLMAEEARQRLRVDVVDGIYLANVSSESPAAEAGLRVGDVITAIRGQPVSTTVDLLITLEHSYPGQDLEMTINREGQEFKVAPALGEMPRYWGQ